MEEIILECQGYGSRAWSCFIQHSRREGNFAADALTKKLVSESFELHVWNHLPKSLSLILLADMIGMEVPRHGALDKNQRGHAFESAETGAAGEKPPRVLIVALA
ncbi:hypothetical protein OIU74_015671 [Salix koriyanagi]|uniref:RNase H type-1 domain-containing protein n=1 Tax=Salix koriyanagi TaxID=2511006 RepID=A0A9Q0PMK8_9ROSI|nr:hypothetical protein OIU74_015671 [Salix koriyanagi]